MKLRAIQPGDLRLSFTSALVKRVFELHVSEHSLTVFVSALYHPRLHFAAQTSSAGGPRKEAPLVVIKLDIINRVADKTGVPKMKAEQAVEALFHSMKEALTRGERIELRGFGVFVVKPRKRGVGRNPRTGEEVAIPSGKTIRFKPGKELQAHEDGETSDSGESVL
jgi:DNA-binding protein HU-beta